MLDISGVYHEGCAAFASVSPNVVADEIVMKTDEGMTREPRYTVVGLDCLVLYELKFTIYFADLRVFLTFFPLFLFFYLVSGTW